MNFVPRGRTHVDRDVVARCGFDPHRLRLDPAKRLRHCRSGPWQDRCGQARRARGALLHQGLQQGWQGRLAPDLVPGESNVKC